MTARQATNFSSEGFDLDALGDDGVTSSGDGNADVIYELGGGASIQARDEPTATPTVADSSTTGAKADADTNADADAPPDPLAKSEASKAEGNASFKAGDYLDAHDSYTDAIEACPGEPTGEQLLKMREEFEEAEREKVAQRHREEMDRRREVDRKEAEKRRQRARARIGEEEEEDSDASASASDGDNTDNEDDDNDKQKGEDTGDAPKPAVFQPPEHPHGSKLAIYHANRAACSLHLNRPADCVEDCTVAIMLNPKYVKAYLRRASAHEVLEQTEDALKDAKVALEIDPRSAAARREVARLQKIEDERLEKLKEETLGKLKDLGNSILGNFGLSLDNFNAVQDPNTGSYSISFNQNAGGGK